MSSDEMGRPIEILLVEDSDTDVLLTREAFHDAKIRNVLHVVEHGEDALAFLRNEGTYTDAPRPDLILLDLNLPRMNGRELLAKIKADEGLKPIPVVVLTTSKQEEDIIESYSLHANCYITKPVDFEKFTGVVGKIEQFWFTVVTLPPR